MNLRQLFSFCFFQGLFWCIASSGFFYIAGLHSDISGLAFSLSFALAHPFLLAMGLMCCAPFIFIGPRTLQGVSVAAATVLTSFFAIDMVVYSQYRFHIGPSMLELFFGPAGLEIFAFSASVWISALLIFLVLLGVEIGLLKLAKRVVFSRKTIFAILGVWLVTFLCYNGLYAWGKFKMVPSIMSQRTVLPFAFPLSANRRLEKLGFTPAKNPYAVNQKGSFTYPLAPLTCQAPAKAKNVLIIVVDSLRSDMLTPEIMPHTYHWAQQPGMTVFNHHLSGGNATAGGIFSLFYGMPHSYWDNVTGFSIPPVLLSQAWQQGYAPAIYASSKLSSPAFDRNVFSAIENLRIHSQGNSSWQRDENAVNDFEQFLNARDPKTPFFGFIFTDAPHAYSYPQEDKKFTPSKPVNYLTLTKNTDPLPYLNEYKNSIYFSDRMINRILNALQEKGLLKNTWVLISGDHGQEMNDSHQNFWGHNSNYTDYQTQVPLVVFDPDKKTTQTVDYFTSHYDIAPTLLQQVFGCTNPAEDYSIGQNLFDSTPRPFMVFSSYTAKAVRIGDSILVLNNLGSVEQYDSHYRPLAQPLDAATVKEALKTFSKFYK